MMSAMIAIERMICESFSCGDKRLVNSHFNGDIGSCQMLTRGMILSFLRLISLIKRGGATRLSSHIRWRESLIGAGSVGITNG